MKTEPPQAEVRVANATGDAALDKTVVAALRGAGWNVPAFIDQPARRASVTIGTSTAARLLAVTFATPLRAATTTTLLLGTDWAPDTE